MRTERIRYGLLSVALAVGAASCAKPPPRPPVMADADRAAQSFAAQRELVSFAPQAFAHADKLRRDAEQAYAAGDLPGAQFLSERALAAYQHALVLARLTKATESAARASRELDEAQKHAAETQAELERLQAEANDIEARLKVLREAIPLTASPTTSDKAREEARLASARSLALDAKLLCVAAELLDPKLDGIGSARDTADELDRRLATPVRPAPIDDAMRARARCLALVTTARRSAAAKSTMGNADALLAEMSAMGGDLAPSRDDRGVVVTLRQLFNGTELAKGAREQLDVLARIAAAHPQFPLQIVVHERGRADAKGKKSGDDRAREQSMGEKIEKQLAEGGVPEAKMKVEPAGAAHPLSAGSGDPARDDRVEIVFVDPGG